MIRSRIPSEGPTSPLNTFTLGVEISHSNMGPHIQTAAPFVKDESVPHTPSQERQGQSGVDQLSDLGVSMCSRAST